MIITRMKYFDIDSITLTTEYHRNDYRLNNLRWAHCERCNGNAYIVACVPLDDAVELVNRGLNDFVGVEGNGSVAANDDIPAFPVWFEFSHIQPIYNLVDGDIVFTIELSREHSHGCIRRVEL